MSKDLPAHGFRGLMWSKRRLSRGIERYLAEKEAIERARAKTVTYDGYLEALLAGHKNIVEVDAFPPGLPGIYLGKGDPLRTKGPISRFDLLEAAFSLGLRVEALEAILANQLALYGSGRSLATRVMNPGRWKYEIRAVRAIRTGGVEIPYLVGRTTKAILNYRVNIDIDPSRLRDNLVRYSPAKEEIEEKGLEKPWERISRLPAVLVESTLVEHRDGQGIRSVFMRRRAGRVFPGCWSPPGGTADSHNEVTALEELREECGRLESIKRARPLGTADQILIARGHEGPELLRYLALIWKLEVTNSDLAEGWLMDKDGGGEWIPIPDNYLVAYEQLGKLTPMATCALFLAGYFDYCPGNLTRIGGRQ